MSSIRRRVLDRPAEEILRPAAAWVLPTAESAVALYENRIPADSRPRDAVNAAHRFAAGARRGKELRTTAVAALKAAGSSGDVVARSAARAASLTAAVAYLHPDLIDATQLKHLYGPIVYTAQAHETACDGDEGIGDAVISDALATATDQVRDLARSLPQLPVLKTRLSRMYAAVDAGLRGAAGR